MLQQFFLRDCGFMWYFRVDRAQIERLRQLISAAEITIPGLAERYLKHGFGARLDLAAWVKFVYRKQGQH